jgi:signal transduction histidine kinase/ActR/RegA family two-component response regulator
MRLLPAAVARWGAWPTIAVSGALALAVAGVLTGVISEGEHRRQQTRELAVQADILARSVSAALAFQDSQAAQEYVDALRANPQIETAAVYDGGGKLLASLARATEPPPLKAPAPSRAGFRRGHVEVSAPVIQGASRLGEVFLSTPQEPAGAFIARHTGASLLVVMAFLLMLAVSHAQASLRRANEELTARAEDLAEANRLLQIQMEEREKAEEALRQSQKMEAIGQLTGGVAHDFNNILMVASSGLDLMDRTTDPVRRNMLRDGIRQAVERGASLTRQLLAISRRSALQPQVVELKSRIEGVRVLLDRSLREDIAVSVELPPDLWPIEVDPSQLEVAILNIAVNARDAMPSGGVIAIRADNVAGLRDGEMEGDFVRLSIQDEGVGMSRDTLRRIFEPFFTTKGVGKGTGLGLAQVYGFTRASGGGVRVQSEPGVGTMVALYLPRSAAALPAVEAPAPAASERAPPVVAAEPQGRVLLVEDEDSVATLVGEMLGELGWQVRRAPTAAIALRVLERERGFELVLSDMVMPGRLSGIDLAREIARRRPDLPVILTTGFSEAAAAAREEGWRLLMKPYRLDALASALDAARRGRRQTAPAHSDVELRP